MRPYGEINIKDYSRTDWLELRRKGIGGSDAGAILGVNKWKTAFEVFIEKTEPLEVNETSEAAYWGTQLEDMVAKEFELRTGKKVRKNNRMMFSKKYPYMMANIDREIVGEDAILECKTANQFLSVEWEDDEIPASYIIQGQHYLAVTGKKKVYYAVLIGGQKFKWTALERDEELINLLIEKEGEFWNNHVIKNLPPALDGTSAAEEYIKNKYPEAEATKSIDLKGPYARRFEELDIIKEQIKELENRKNEIENNIKLEMEDAEFGFTENYKVIYKNITSSRLDTKALKKDMPDIAEKYIKESISRRFSYEKLSEE